VESKTLEVRAEPLRVLRTDLDVGCGLYPALNEKHVYSGLDGEVPKPIARASCSCQLAKRILEG
jgi:hypothetical protein